MEIQFMCRDDIDYLMAVIDGGSDLTEDPASLQFRQNFAFAEIVVELSAGGVLHHQHHLLLVFKHFVDVNDVGMTHRRHDLNLASDPDQIRLRFNLGFLDRFDGNL